MNNFLASLGGKTLAIETITVITPSNMCRWLLLCVLSLFCLLISPSNAQNCNNDTCITFFNRTCGAADTGGACTGPCLVNHTDFAGHTEACFDIREIDWEMFIQKFDPTFKAEDYTKEERLEILRKILQYISEYNANNPNVTLGLNKYSADSEEDLKAKAGYRNVEGSEDLLGENQMIVGATSGLPSKRDWVEMGAVTSVKDQSRCGCCWGIAVAGTIEGAAAINSNFTYLQSVSFQQFISCDDQNDGCNGGNIIVAMYYAVVTNERGGIARLNDYPYTDEKGETTQDCDLRPDRAVESNDGKIVVTFDDGRSFQERLERMKFAVSFQPIAMVIKSTCRLFNNYKSGIITDDEDCRCEEVDCIDHAVLLVGYNDEDDIPYWKIKNSWGTGWGEGGYIRVAQESGGRRWGLFGMLSQGVVALDVQNVTGQVYDEPQTAGSNLTGWQIALVAIAGFLAVVLCCCGVKMLVQKK